MRSYSCESRSSSDIAAHRSRAAPLPGRICDRISTHETTLDGSKPVDALRRRRRMPVEDDEAVVAIGTASAGGEVVVVRPMELRTFEVEVEWVS